MTTSQPCKLANRMLKQLRGKVDQSCVKIQEKINTFTAKHQLNCLKSDNGLYLTSILIHNCSLLSHLLLYNRRSLPLPVPRCLTERTCKSHCQTLLGYGCCKCYGFHCTTVSHCAGTHNYSQLAGLALVEHLNDTVYPDEDRQLGELIDCNAVQYGFTEKQVVGLTIL